MTALPFAVTTPISVGRVGLRARDAGRLAEYYKIVVGLKELRRSGNTIALGAGDRELLEIEGSPALQPDDPRSAGLFHTAFLLPSRRDLARWAKRAIDESITIDGASDHLASEAIYLSDPEGNGIEIYADRPPESWWNADGTPRIATDPLDFKSLFAELDAATPVWSGLPDGSVVGHAHLRVGDTREAESWWHEAQGLNTTARYGDQAVFLSSGRYHHHIGANSWQSRDAGPRAADRAGLGFVELHSREATAEHVSHDPWGNEIRVLPKP